MDVDSWAARLSSASKRYQFALQCRSGKHAFQFSISTLEFKISRVTFILFHIRKILTRVFEFTTRS